LRLDRARLQNFQYTNIGSPNYQYYRGNQYYYVNQYGADLLRRAINSGYEEGYRAGQADRADGWNFDYQSSDAYLDGSYGYDGYYVDFSEYQYYFREGFQRGYEDGYYSRSQYGRYSGGKIGILANVLNVILSLSGLQ
jgi:flagellar biosynthesis/type III secretory pathway protein FliH